MRRVGLGGLGNGRREVNSVSMKQTKIQPFTFFQANKFSTVGRRVDLEMLEKYKSTNPLLTDLLNQKKQQQKTVKSSPKTVKRLTTHILQLNVEARKSFEKRDFESAASLYQEIVQLISQKSEDKSSDFELSTALKNKALSLLQLASFHLRKRKQLGAKELEVGAKEMKKEREKEMKKEERVKEMKKGEQVKSEEEVLELRREAVQLLEESLEIREKLYKQFSEASDMLLSVYHSLEALAKAKKEMGELEASEKLYERLCLLSPVLLQTNHIDYSHSGQLFNNFAVLKITQATSSISQANPNVSQLEESKVEIALKQAETLLEQSVSHFSKINDTKEIFVALDNLLLVHQKTNQITLQIGTLRKILRLKKESFEFPSELLPPSLSLSLLLHLSLSLPPQQATFSPSSKKGEEQMKNKEEENDSYLRQILMKTKKLGEEDETEMNELLEDEKELSSQLNNSKEPKEENRENQESDENEESDEEKYFSVQEEIIALLKQTQQILKEEGEAKALKFLSSSQLHQLNQLHGLYLSS